MPNNSSMESKHASPAQALEAFISKLGPQTESALYTIVCNRSHPARGNIDKALANGTDSAMVAVAPHLMSEYKFSLMLATQVAVFAAQQVAAWGQSAVCAALTARRTRETLSAPPKEKKPAPAIEISLDDLPEIAAASTDSQPAPVTAPVKRRPGRPKGSKNKKKAI